MGSRMLERSGHRVVAYDARGHGRSTPAPDPAAYGYERLADDLEAVLDALGSSARCWRARRWAPTPRCASPCAHPERVAALGLITPAYDPDAAAREPGLAAWDALADGLREGGVEGFVRRL